MSRATRLIERLLADLRSGKFLIAGPAFFRGVAALINSLGMPREGREWQCDFGRF